ncbi:MAG: zinc-binding dehydrogenase [Arenicellales bacterium]|jgi:alcohol dehydrogenase|nr:zinc-binding dehydrogenase [Arenicellales bacterium]|tara:strand:+ start:7826 stop:8902 length:1077 start_codon:yes stop_codon:yes gene_type:complete
MSTNMNAVVIEEHGDADVMSYRDIEMPALQPGQVRIAMRACSLNYHDILTRRGMPGVRTPLPMILGCDCAGVIAEMAPDVKGWAVGERVLADPLSRFSRREDPDPAMPIKFLGDTRWGGYADYCVVWDRQLIRIPEAVPIELAACLPVAYGSAYRMLLHHGKIQAGERVLVLGASGGVGNCAVQLAKSAGCFVVGACGNETRCRTLTELFGVDETINTAEEDIVKATRRITGGTLLQGGGFDAVVNSQGGEFWAKGLRCLKAGGRMVTNGALAGFDPPTDIRYIFQGELTIQGSNGWSHQDIENLIALVADGGLEPHIGATYSLERGIEAHIALEMRSHFGKIVITGSAPAPLGAGAI